MRRPLHNRRIEASSRSLARWGAVAACLGGISYGLWGYLDNPDASEFVIGVVGPVLGVATPALFLGGLLGLYYWTGGGPLRRAGFLVGSIGAVLGIFDALDWWEADRWIPLYAALTAAGLGILAGLYFWRGRQGDPPQGAALLVALAGTVLGLFDGLDWWEPNWWILLLVGLTAGGLDMVFGMESRVLGLVVLASGTLGWVSLLTDPTFSGVLVPIYPIHFAFAALFCLSCLAWGATLFREAS